jgi:hypothetical protein
VDTEQFITLLKTLLVSLASNCFRQRFRMDTPAALYKRTIPSPLHSQGIHRLYNIINIHQLDRQISINQLDNCNLLQRSQRLKN